MEDNVQLQARQCDQGILNDFGEIPPRRRRQKSKVHPELKKFSFLKECLVIVVLCIVVPTFDVYSDGALIYQLFTEPTHFQCRNGNRISLERLKNGYEHCEDRSHEEDSPGWKHDDPTHRVANPIFGIVLPIPMTLSLFFTIPHWWKTEKTKCRRLLTFPLLILQLWPQYRAFKLLIALWKDQNKYHDKLEKFNRDVSSLEPFIEAVPTVFILLAILVRDYEVFYTHSYVRTSDLGIFGIPKVIIFWTTFGLSVFSASIGISKFIKIGPCQIIPSDKWHCGFFLVFLNVVFTLCAKGCVLAFSLGDKKYEDFVIIFIIWLATCILPHLIFAILILVKAVGLKNTGRVIWRYPALVLMPTFSFWTMGPPQSSNSCCGYCQRSDSIEVSYFYTLLNAIVTIVVNIVFLFFVSTDSSSFVACPLFFAAFICLLVLTCCSNSECCGTPFTNRENFYIEDLDEVTDQNKEVHGLEMQEV